MTIYLLMAKTERSQKVDEDDRNGGRWSSASSLVSSARVQGVGCFEACDSLLVLLGIRHLPPLRLNCNDSLTKHLSNARPAAVSLGFHIKPDQSDETKAIAINGANDVSQCVFHTIA